MSLRNLFKKEKFLRPGVGDRVRHLSTGRLGSVAGTGKIMTNTITVYALTVNFDDGLQAVLIPEQEFIKIDRRR